MANVLRYAMMWAPLVVALGWCSAFANAAVPLGQQVMLVNAKTGKCLTIAGGTSPANSLPTVQYDCDGDLSRRWVLTVVSGAYQIMNAKTAKCLTVEGGTSSDN